VILRHANGDPVSPQKPLRIRRVSVERELDELG
jgi:hypothetical protein